MHQLKRIFRHLIKTRRSAQRAFPQKNLKDLHAAITDGEDRHRAQLKLIIEPALDFYTLLDGETSRSRAHTLFSRYRVWDTEENCGVLVYINLADHKVEIITDRATGRAVKQTDWEAACKLMTKGFAEGRFYESALEGIQHINTLLSEHFPVVAGGRQHNELSDRPVML